MGRAAVEVGWERDPENLVSEVAGWEQGALLGLSQKNPRGKQDEQRVRMEKGKMADRVCS